MAYFDLQFAPFWAVLIGLLNFVPYVGTVLSIFFPVAFATMQFGDLGTVITLLAALSVGQFVIGFFLDPWLMGSSLNMSPFVILVSITVWGGLWGIPGRLPGSADHRLHGDGLRRVCRDAADCRAAVAQRRSGRAAVTAGIAGAMERAPAPVTSAICAARSQRR